MVKEKLVQNNKKIANAVVKSYKAIENGAVKGYKTIEDKFVDTFLRRDGETIEEAKIRLKKEQADRKKESQKYLQKTTKIQNQIKEKYRK